MKVMVTGHRGYIGPHLVELLKEANHEVIGVDIGLFDGCEWEAQSQADIEIEEDIRNLTPSDFLEVDAVMHLAGISNDPMGDLDASLTYDINLAGTIHIAKMAKSAGVKKFLFSSSCSIYGKGEKLDLDESSQFNPVTPYAESKIKAEQELSKLADQTFCPIFLRNATAYGFSPMFRQDLVVNNLLGSAVTKNQIRVMSDGEPWRPLIHCRDIARAFIALLEADEELVRAKGINIGDSKENFQVKDVAQKVAKVVPSAEIVFTGEVGHDPRDYRVDFSLLSRILPNFKFEYCLDSGILDLHQKMLARPFTLEDFEGNQFVRLKILRNKMDLL